MVKLNFKQFIKIQDISIELDGLTVIIRDSRFRTWLRKAIESVFLIDTDDPEDITVSLEIADNPIFKRDRSKFSVIHKREKFISKDTFIAKLKQLNIDVLARPFLITWEDLEPFFKVNGDFRGLLELHAGLSATSVELKDYEAQWEEILVSLEGSKQEKSTWDQMWQLYDKENEIETERTKLRGHHCLLNILDLVLKAAKVREIVEEQSAVPDYRPVSIASGRNGLLDAFMEIQPQYREDDEATVEEPHRMLAEIRTLNCKIARAEMNVLRELRKPQLEESPERSLQSEANRLNSLKRTLKDEQASCERYLKCIQKCNTETVKNHLDDDKCYCDTNTHLLLLYPHIKIITPEPSKQKVFELHDIFDLACPGHLNVLKYFVNLDDVHVVATSIEEAVEYCSKEHTGNKKVLQFPSKPLTTSWKPNVDESEIFICLGDVTAFRLADRNKLTKEMKSYMNNCVYVDSLEHAHTAIANKCEMVLVLPSQALLAFYVIYVTNRDRFESANVQKWVYCGAFHGMEVLKRLYKEEPDVESVKILQGTIANLLVKIDEIDEEIQQLGVHGNDEPRNFIVCKNADIDDVWGIYKPAESIKCSVKHKKNALSSMQFVVEKICNQEKLRRFEARIMRTAKTCRHEGFDLSEPTIENINQLLPENLQTNDHKNAHDMLDVVLNELKVNQFAITKPIFNPQNQYNGAKANDKQRRRELTRVKPLKEEVFNKITDELKQLIDKLNPIADDYYKKLAHDSLCTASIEVSNDPSKPIIYANTPTNDEEMRHLAVLALFLAINTVQQVPILILDGPLEKIPDERHNANLIALLNELKEDRDIGLLTSNPEQRTLVNFDKAYMIYDIDEDSINIVDVTQNIKEI